MNRRSFLTSLACAVGWQYVPRSVVLMTSTALPPELPAHLRFEDLVQRTLHRQGAKIAANLMRQNALLARLEAIKA